MQNSEYPRGAISLGTLPQSPATGEWCGLQAGGAGTVVIQDGSNPPNTVTLNMAVGIPVMCTITKVVSGSATGLVAFIP